MILHDKNYLKYTFLSTLTVNISCSMLDTILGLTYAKVQPYNQ